MYMKNHMKKENKSWLIDSRNNFSKSFGSIFI